MVRLASLLALACLAMAASALVSAPKRISVAPPDENKGDKKLAPQNRCAGLVSSGRVSFHARFSLN